MTVIVVCAVSLAFSVLNLVATLFLSNFVFRAFVAGPTRPEPPRTPERGSPGLMEVKDAPTYDPRFMRARS